MAWFDYFLELAGENFGEFSYLDYLGEKTLANSLFQINTEIKGSVKLREKTLAIGHQLTEFASVFSCCYTVLFTCCILKCMYVE